MPNHFNSIMKNKLIVPAVGLTLFLVACSQAEDALQPLPPDNPTPEESVVPSTAEYDYDVTSTEITNIVKAHGNHESRAKSYTISAIVGKDNHPKMYVINYGDNQGWQIISASKNVHPILAYAEEGQFNANNLSNLPFGLANWLDNASIMIDQSYALDSDSVLKVRASWHQYENKNEISRSGAHDYDPHDILKYISQEEYDKLVSIMNDSIKSWHNQGYDVQICDSDYMDENPVFFEEALGTIFGPYTDAVCQLTFRLYREWSDLSSTRLVKSTWQQENSYNQSFPTLTNGKNAYAGCGPVAIGQLMRFYEHPKSLDWNNMPLNEPTKTTSNFLYNIAGLAGAKYEINGTSTRLTDEKNVLIGFGYKVSETKKYQKGDKLPNIGYMRADITVADPYKYMFGDYGGHSWVIGGSGTLVDFRQTIYYTFRSRLTMDTFGTPGWPEEISHNNFVYMAWGWDENFNGFFNNSVVRCPIASKLENIKYFSVELP